MASSKFTPEQDYPDLSKHNNHMAKHLTQEIYANLRDKKTASGFTLDECIQTGKVHVNMWFSVYFFFRS